MKMLGKLMMVASVSGAMLAVAASDMRSVNEPMAASGTNAWNTATNAASTNTVMKSADAWDRSATEAKDAGRKAADVTGDTLRKAGDSTRDAVKDAGGAIERTGERMQ